MGVVGWKCEGAGCKFGTGTSQGDRRVGCERDRPSAVNAGTVICDRTQIAAFKIVGRNAIPASRSIGIRTSGFGSTAQHRFLIGFIHLVLEVHGCTAGSSLKGDNDSVGLIPVRATFITRGIGNQKHISFAVGRVGVANNGEGIRNRTPSGISHPAQTGTGQQLERLTIIETVALGNFGHIQARNGLGNWGRIRDGAHGRLDVGRRRLDRNIVNPKLDGAQGVLRRIAVKIEVQTVDRIGNRQCGAYRNRKMLPSGRILDRGATESIPAASSPTLWDRRDGTESAVRKKGRICRVNLQIKVNTLVNSDVGPRPPRQVPVNFTVFPLTAVAGDRPIQLHIA